MRQLITTCRILGRVPFHPAVSLCHQRSAHYLHTACTCNVSRLLKSQITSNLQSRGYADSKPDGGSKGTKSFDEYYTAVIEAHKKNENLVMYKYKELSDNAAVREAEIRRWMFNEAVDIYIEKTETPQASGLRRGHIEFIYQALDRMKELGVNRELACYKALIKVFPPGMMVPATNWQVEFYHYPKQQNCTVQILEQMEDNAVVPDQEMRDLLEARFGKKGHVVRKYRRMVYWMRKFQNANPYKLPHYLPLDPVELAILALKKMSVDLENEIKVFKVGGEENQIFIASAQSPTQRDMIRKHRDNMPLYVEGGFPVWLRDQRQTYFILRADSDPKVFQYPSKEQLEEQELGNFETMFDAEEPQELAVKPNVHQQEEGTILGMCITETGTKDSLISWIRCLQDANPSLEKIPIVFTLRSPEEPLVTVTGDTNQETETVVVSK